MAKVTANGSRRSYTGATFGGGSMTPSEKAAQKLRLAKKRKALAEKAAAINLIVKRMKKDSAPAKRLLAQATRPQGAVGSQLADALAKALITKARKNEGKKSKL